MTTNAEDIPTPATATKTRWMAEQLHTHVSMSYEIDTILYEEQTQHQHLIIFENKRFGRVMMLDNVIQLTSQDEFIYHEMMAHMPLFSHPDPKNILIIGGGDGGVAREVLRHKAVESLTLCEIDDSVIEMGKKYFPQICSNAFADPRMTVTIQDGTQIVKHNKGKFDVIMVDSTDPIGPGAVLFTHEFYKDCADCLTENGILVTQNGVPFLQDQELRDTMGHFKTLFKDYSAFVAATPTYVGGLMSYGWGSHNPDSRQLNRDHIANRFQATGLTTKYYNPDLHLAAFALPTYIKSCIPA